VLSQNDVAFWVWPAADDQVGAGGGDKAAAGEAQEWVGEVDVEGLERPGMQAEEASLEVAGLTMVLTDTLVVVDEGEGEEEWFDGVRPGLLLRDGESVFDGGGSAVRVSVRGRVRVGE